MWNFLSRRLLRNRHACLAVLLLVTGFMGYHAMSVKTSYELARIVPESNEKYQAFKQFKTIFGEDANMMLIGVATSKWHKVDFFNDWKALGDSMLEVRGITDVLSIPHSFNVYKNTDTRSFDVVNAFPSKVQSQRDLDSLLTTFFTLPFYRNLLYNEESDATFLALRFNGKELNSKERLFIVDDIVKITDRFEAKHDVKIHHSGLPFIRSYTTSAISKELKMFLGFAMLILTIVLYVLFRNPYAVIFPMLVVIAGALWPMGIIQLMGYKITLLTALIPTLILVIGIPNCIYMLNKYHNEFRIHGNKHKALMRTVEKIGNVTFFTNLTTAIGFGVFAFTSTEVLQEFGIVAFLSIIAVFFISTISIPIVFSYLPEPKTNHTKHLERKILNSALERFERWARFHPKYIVTTVAGIIILAGLGVSQLNARGYILDDIPEDSKVYQDLLFFEHHFKGVMPFEVVIDTKKAGRATRTTFLRKLAQAQDTLQTYDVFSKPLSIAEAMKFASQAYYNGREAKYRIPTNFELSSDPNLIRYLRSSKIDSSVNLGFTDDSLRYARISLSMANIGSDSIPKLTNRLKPQFDAIFDTADYKVSFTGTSVLSLEGFKFLIEGLINSVVLAFILIAIIMAYLFRSVKMLLISLVPNVIPLLFTAAMMGYFNIPLKPSTVLIFSIAFGISVDYTIHFLAKYRQDLQRHNWDITTTVISTLRETGVSMIYTSFILLFGFIVFTGSSFQGTVNLGKLTSITLVVSMLCNLVVLPSLLILFDNKKKRKQIVTAEPMESEALPLKDEC